MRSVSLSVHRRESFVVVAPLIVPRSCPYSFSPLFFPSFFSLIVPNQA